MVPLYEERKEKFCAVHKISVHASPHLHHSLEIVYVTDGTLELGIAQELYHMEQGDMAIIFPDVIHHYQVFSPETSRAVYLFAHPNLCEPFREELRKYCPGDPVIRKQDIHKDVLNALHTLSQGTMGNELVEQAFIQIILARSMPLYDLVEKSSIGSDDLIYRTVAYIAGHFTEELSLERVAKELLVSKYVLSRVFSSTFHTNFNQYLNEQRLNYAASLLECTNRTITEICMDAGFQSLRTFHRAFQEKYRMTPGEYKKRRKKC